MRAFGWFRAFAGAALVAATVTPADALTLPQIPTVSFRVVDASGAAVRGVHVYTTVLEDPTVTATKTRGDAHGVIAVRVPVDNPVARARTARRLPVNILMRVFDKRPGEPDINAAYVAASVNLTDPALPMDLSGITGQVFRLEPGRTAFVSEKTASTDESDPQDEEDCPDDNGGIFLRQTCPYVEDFPAWSYNTPIPLASNVGGGGDMESELVYRSTTRMTTSIAVKAGVSGFAEAGGGVTTSQELTTSLTWREGRGDNAQAIQLTEMKRIRNIFCEYDLATSERRCQHEGMYIPHNVHGSQMVPSHSYHDTLNAVTDCFTGVAIEWGESSGQTIGMSYYLTLGPSEDYVLEAGAPVPLHAQSTTTKSSVREKELRRSWAVIANPSKPNHYVMVKGGGARRDRTLSGGGPGVCPENSPGEVWTHSSNVDLFDPTSPETREQVAKDANEYADECVKQRPGC